MFIILHTLSKLLVFFVKIKDHIILDPFKWNGGKYKTDYHIRKLSASSFYY